MKTLMFDIECYRNYFLVMFLNLETQQTMHFEMHSDCPKFNINVVRDLMAANKTVGFNSINYDLPMLYAALNGANNDHLKNISDGIIVKGLKPWHVEQKCSFQIPKKLNHIDLIEVAPGKTSLKAYGGRMHSARLQDLPIEPSALISPTERETMRLYCANDLITTADLYNKLIPQLELREKMSKQYNVNLMSKSDAQIAEAVIKGAMEVKKGRKLYASDEEIGETFAYERPSFITFATDQMNRGLSTLEDTTFAVADNGKPIGSLKLEDFPIKFNRAQYTIGIGGLHSCEESTAHDTREGDFILIDRDVASYYPAIILGCNLFPKQLGPEFLDIYRTIVNQRLEAKAIGNKTAADSLKITINGSFGKFGNKYSVLYSPKLLIQTTLTGQLSLLMLIEMLETMARAQVVSANTDGIVIKCHRTQKPMVDNVISEWEKRTGFTTEETLYKAFYSRDVNNYIAIKEDGGVKLKGAYTPAGLQKNPTSEICIDAAIALLKNNTPITQTIRKCPDIRKFVTVRTVKGGAIKNNDFLGKCVRWYYRTGETGTINYKINNHTVPRTQGAHPIMELPRHFPADIDYGWYIRETASILKDVGYGIA